jgi:DNA transformation protein and related proteins
MLFNLSTKLKPMTKSAKSLRDLPNIGTTLEHKLNAIGIRSIKELKSERPEVLYSKLCTKEGKRLPVCYYLYTLEAAVKNVDWRDLSELQKRRLLKAVEDL